MLCVDCGPILCDDCGPVLCVDCGPVLCVHCGPVLCVECGPVPCIDPVVVYISRMWLGRDSVPPAADLLPVQTPYSAQCHCDHRQDRVQGWATADTWVVFLSDSIVMFLQDNMDDVHLIV